MLILPAIASTAMAFFMRQYMLPSLFLEIVQAAWIDGAGEFYIFNKIAMPIMVSLLRGDIYKTEYGSVYLGLALTVLPLIIVYLLLSKYIIAGVALGGVKG